MKKAWLKFLHLNTTYQTCVRYSKNASNLISKTRALIWYIEQWLLLYIWKIGFYLISGIQYPKNGFYLISGIWYPKKYLLFNIRKKCSTSATNSINQDQDKKKRDTSATYSINPNEISPLKYSQNFFFYFYFPPFTLLNLFNIINSSP